MNSWGKCKTKQQWDISAHYIHRNDNHSEQEQKLRVRISYRAGGDIKTLEGNSTTS